jgi:hypothetical protein
VRQTALEELKGAMIVLTFLLVMTSDLLHIWKVSCPWSLKMGGALPV